MQILKGIHIFSEKLQENRLSPTGQPQLIGIPVHNPTNI
jgi:hypothetical protein